MCHARSEYFVWIEISVSSNLVQFGCERTSAHIFFSSLVCLLCAWICDIYLHFESWQRGLCDCVSARQQSSVSFIFFSCIPKIRDAKKNLIIYLLFIHSIGVFPWADRFLFPIHIMNENEKKTNPRWLVDSEVITNERDGNKATTNMRARWRMRIH